MVSAGVEQDLAQLRGATCRANPSGTCIVNDGNKEIMEGALDVPNGLRGIKAKIEAW